MKPTEKQKKACDAIIQEISWWRDSNDIDSPTHYSDMEDCLRADLDDIISEEEICDIEDCLRTIFGIIKRNK